MSKLNKKELEKFLNSLWIDFESMVEAIIIRHEAKGHHKKANEVRKQLGKNKQAYKQIVDLIKIFYAKEIPTGPIKKDISQSDLIEWLQGINQAATAVKDYYVMKATIQLIEMIGNQISEENLFEIKAQEYERGLKDAKPAVDEGFVNTWANDFATATLHDKQMHKRIIYMLKEIDVEVVEK